MFRTSLVHLQERFLQAVCADFVRGNMRTARHVQPLLRNGPNLHKQLVKNAPGFEPVRFEKCRANICDE